MLQRNARWVTTLCAAIGLVGTSGCGFLLTQAPPTNYAELNHFDCTDSNAAPILDGVFGGTLILLAVVAANGSDASSGAARSEYVSGIFTGLSIGGLYGFAARVGLRKTGQCREARQAQAMRLVGEVLSATDLVPGSKIRITAPRLGLEDATGVLQRATEDTLVVSFVRRVESIGVSDITWIRVPVGRTTSPGIGLLMGALIGGATGAAVGYASGDDPPGSGLFPVSAGEKAVVGGWIVGFWGGLVGVVIGARSRSDVWSPPLPLDGNSGGAEGVIFRLYPIMFD